MDDVELLLPEPSELSPIRRVGDRMPFAPRSFKRPKSYGVWVRFLISSKPRREDMDMMPLIAELVNQELNADAHPIKNWPNAIREYGNA